jgi:hypothetical protein
MSVPQPAELMFEAESRCGAVTVQFPYLETSGVRKWGMKMNREALGMRLVQVFWSEISVKNATYKHIGR